MASWLKAAEGLLEAVDKTAKNVKEQHKHVPDPQPTTDQPPSRPSSSHSSSSTIDTTKTRLPSPSPPTTTTNISKPSSTQSIPSQHKPPPPPPPPPSSSSSLPRAAPSKASTKNKQKQKPAPQPKAKPTPPSKIPSPPPPPQAIVVDESNISPPVQVKNTKLGMQEQQEEEDVFQQPNFDVAAAIVVDKEEMEEKDTKKAVEEQEKQQLVDVDSEVIAQPAAVEATTSDINNSNDAEAQEEEEEQAAAAAAAALSERDHKMMTRIESLKKRIDRLESENQQLEEMLATADAAAKDGGGEVDRLEDALAKAEVAKITAEATALAACTAKDAEIKTLMAKLNNALEESRKLEKQVDLMQQASEQMVQENKLSEGQLLLTLRAEVEATEKQLEEERAAHAETRRGGALREQEMDAALAGAGAALGPLQRQIEDKSARLSAAEERVAGLEAELDESGRQLQAAQSQLQRAKEAAAASSSDAMTARIEAAEAAVVEAKAAAQKAQVEAQTAAAETTRLTQQVTELNQRLAIATASDSRDLYRRTKELSDMLMTKQSQLERLAADSAAQRLALERQVQSAKTEAQKALRRRPSFLASSSSATDGAMIMMMGEGGGGGSDMMVSMETLPAYTRLAGDKRVGGAVKAGAKLLDATTNQAVYVLVRYPIWRLGLFLYIIGMHLFVYFLLHRLQHKAFLAHEALIDNDHRALG